MAHLIQVRRCLPEQLERFFKAIDFVDLLNVALCDSVFSMTHTDVNGYEILELLQFHLIIMIVLCVVVLAKLITLINLLLLLMIFV